MLKEFAFTPQIFDPSAAASESAWRAQMTALAVGLFHAADTPRVVVSGLFFHKKICVWKEETAKLILQIPDQNLRAVAQSLFHQVTKHLIFRPPATDWPGESESGWIQEAVATHTNSPLDRILAQDASNDGDSAPVTALAAVIQPEFWSILHPKVGPRLSVEAAVDPAQVILAHSDVLVLSMPYASCDAFSFACIRRACTRPAGCAVPTIHVHRRGPENLAKTSTWLRGQFRSLPRSCRIHVHFWPESATYRERFLVGFQAADLGGGSVREVPRWGMHFSHVWSEGHELAEAPSVQRLMTKEEIAAQLDRLKTLAASVGVQSFEVGPTMASGECEANTV